MFLERAHPAFRTTYVVLVFTKKKLHELFIFLYSTAAILHLSHNVQSKLIFTVTDFNSYNSVKTGNMTGAEKKNGKMTLPLGPGLGVEPNMEVLGDPVFVIS